MSNSSTNDTRELGVSIVNFVEYLGVFVLKCHLHDVYTAKSVLTRRHKVTTKVTTR